MPVTPTPRGEDRAVFRVRESVREQSRTVYGCRQGTDDVPASTRLPQETP